MKILFVEDNEVDHFIASTVLKENLGDVELTWALHGDDALKLLREDHNYDFILLDINMPLMSGLEFLEVYHAEFANQLPVFPLSSSSDPKDLSTATSYDCVVKFLQKPIGDLAVKEICKFLESLPKNEARVALQSPSALEVF